MDFFEEMRWREMLHDAMPGAEEATQTQMCTGYIGFDPTAPSLTIGNYVQLRVLQLWQRSGHKPIVLMGGATGRIGDPSGKDQERQLKSYDELDKNLKRQSEQMEKYLEFGTQGNKAVMRNNLDFYRDMNVLDFLRDVGKTLTVNYMMSKDSVKNRLESGLSFTEFSYQLLQSYDFQVLYEKENCRFQMGGSDQWGNITSGAEFIRRNIQDGKAYAVTSKLLTKADGKKFGKSEKGNLWLDPNMTSPYQFYQFWINADDADIPKFLKYFSDKPMAQINEMIEQIDSDPRQIKKELAEEITTAIHSAEDMTTVKEVSEIMFNRQLSNEVLKGLKKETLQMISQEIVSFEVPRDAVTNGIDIESLTTTHAPIFDSLSKCRNAIKGNAVSVNKIKISDAKTNVTNDHMIHNAYIFIENGKKNKYLIKVV